MTSKINALLEKNPVVPVVVIKDEKHALPLADALIAGGIDTMEVTLRTDAALNAIKLLKKERPQLSIGAGTVTTIERLRASVDAGVDYIVSPGTTPALFDAFLKENVALLPGVATISEVMALAEKGIKTLKFFPANVNGGTTALKAFGSVLPDISFCPTGGIDPNNMSDYLALSNVIAVGGSWITPANLMQEAKWDDITRLAKLAYDTAAKNK